MSFLEQLRKQAEEQKAQQESSNRSLEQLAAETDQAMNSVNKYFIDLANQLNVIRPASNRTFLIGGTSTLRDLCMCEFRVMARRRGLKHEDPWHYIKMDFRYAGDQPLEVTKDFEAIASFESLLSANGMKFVITNERERIGNRNQPANYEIQQLVPAEVMVTGDPALAELTFLITNVERFSAFAIMFPAQKVDSALLDELTKFILGHPNTFRNGGRYQAVSR